MSLPPELHGCTTAITRDEYVNAVQQLLAARNWSFTDKHQGSERIVVAETIQAQAVITLWNIQRNHKAD